MDQRVNSDRVMIVDDDKLNQMIALEALEGISELKAFSSGKEALDALDSFSPNLVLLDVMMSGINGYEVCKQIRMNQKLKYTKIILISGKSMLDAKLKGYEFGADDYVTKPIVPDELFAKAKVFLHLNKIERELEEINQDLDKKVQEKTKELLETQAALTHSAKMAALGEMAGGVAHEINNPLATIGIISEQIKRIVNMDVDWKTMIPEMADTIHNSVTHIAAIVHGLRTFSRDGSQDMMNETLLKQIFNDTFNLCQAKFKTHEVRLDIAPYSEETHVYCRPVQITQVLLNLISNAYDAAMESKEKWIKIFVTQKDKGVEIHIVNSGAKIPENIQEKIFQPFFTTKEIGKGTGLGLSISKGIIDEHKGTLTLNTKNENTEFIVFIPTKKE